MKDELSCHCPSNTNFPQPFYLLMEVLSGLALYGQGLLSIPFEFRISKNPEGDFPVYKSACIWHFDRNYSSNEAFSSLENVMPRTIYTMQVWHEELGKYREIRGADANVVKQKADAQIRQWSEMWARRQEVELKKATKESAAKEKKAKKELAEARTRDAQESIADLQNILTRGLMRNSAIDWESLKDKGDYPEPKPQRPKPISEPPEPQKGDIKYRPKLSLFNALSVLVSKER
jgi:hypothetical protein